ncbi:MAG: metallophosphoesterase [Planctomycetia bacterium]|nr:metallophosphoesterase [Planctomycetia bacterium]
MRAPAARSTPGPTRRRLLAGAGLVAAGLPTAAAVDGFLVTPGRLQTTDHAIASRSARPDRRLRLLQVSDLHLRHIGRLETRLLDGLHGSRADLLLLTGDMIDRRLDLGRLETFLHELPSAPRRFAILGNWEHWSGVPPEELGRIYERHGVELLVNRSVEIEVAGARLRITGLDDLRGGTPDASAALLGAEPCPNHLLLAHCPLARDVVPLPEAHPADLLLAGHTHGGQVAPWGVALALPEGSGRYVAGWYRDAGPPMYVSRGIGTSLVPVRLGATPELVRVDWSLA